METQVGFKIILGLITICGTTFTVLFFKNLDIAYLHWKDPQDYSGIESYVAKKLEENDLLWIPFNKAIELADLNEDESAV
jgi:hypothetical protein